MCKFRAKEISLKNGGESPTPMWGLDISCQVPNIRAMISRLLKKVADIAVKHLGDRLDSAEQVIAELQGDNQRLRRDIDNLTLDMDALYDKVKTALGRISQRDRRQKANDPPAEENGRSSVDEINRLIQDGVYDAASS